MSEQMPLTLLEAACIERCSSAGGYVGDERCDEGGSCRWRRRGALLYIFSRDALLLKLV